jgi:hypothetical protein
MLVDPNFVLAEISLDISKLFRTLVAYIYMTLLHALAS